MNHGSCKLDISYLDIAGPLYYAALLGLTTVEQELIKKVHVNTKGGFHGSTLYAALYNNHLEIAGVLLDNKANVNVQCLKVIQNISDCFLKRKYLCILVFQSMAMHYRQHLTKAT